MRHLLLGLRRADKITGMEHFSRPVVMLEIKLQEQSTPQTYSPDIKIRETDKIGATPTLT